MTKRKRIDIEKEKERERMEKAKKRESVYVRISIATTPYYKSFAKRSYFRNIINHDQVSSIERYFLLLTDQTK